MSIAVHIQIRQYIVVNIVDYVNGYIVVNIV